MTPNRQALDHDATYILSKADGESFHHRHQKQRSVVSVYTAEVISERSPKRRRLHLQDYYLGNDAALYRKRNDTYMHCYQLIGYCVLVVLTSARNTMLDSDVVILDRLISDSHQNPQIAH